MENQPSTPIEGKWNILSMYALASLYAALLTIVTWSVIFWLLFYGYSIFKNDFSAEYFPFISTMFAAIIGIPIGFVTCLFFGSWIHFNLKPKIVKNSWLYSSLIGGSIPSLGILIPILIFVPLDFTHWNWRDSQGLLFWFACFGGYGVINGFFFERFATKYVYASAET